MLRQAVIGIGTLMFPVLACGEADAQVDAAKRDSAVQPASGTASQQPASPTFKPALKPALKDVVLGMPDAPVRIVEYASTTCPVCQHFHAQVLPKLKARYIFMGEASFVLRSFPTAPRPLALAGAALARCAGEDKYYDVIDDLFLTQAETLEAARIGAGQRAIANIGARHGMSAEMVEACVNDPEIAAYLDREIRDAAGVDRTPVVFVNGVKAAAPTFEAIATLVEEQLAIHRAALEAEGAPPDGVTVPIDPPVQR
ncbi:thioredoxin domain-containing protein [bacterium]|nr:thioredoxin domain-containing protein [bacterium]